MLKNKSFLIVLIILIVALGLRLYLLQSHKILETDSPAYIRLGQNLIAGKGYIDNEGYKNLWFPPLYPILIGISSLITNNLELASRLISILFGVLLIIPVFLFVKRFYNEKSAYLASILTAIYPVLAYLSTIAYSDSLYIFLTMTIILVGWVTLTENKPYLYFIII